MFARALIEIDNAITTAGCHSMSWNDSCKEPVSNGCVAFALRLKASMILLVPFDSRKGTPLGLDHEIPALTFLTCSIAGVANEAKMTPEAAHVNIAPMKCK